jgi:pyrimidine-nucleoside phosphorylase
VHPRLVAMAALHLGAGRQKKEDSIDHAVGIEVLKSVGEAVAVGEPLLCVHARTEDSLQAVLPSLQQAIEISPQPVEPVSVVLQRLV